MLLPLPAWQRRAACVLLASFASASAADSNLSLLSGPPVSLPPFHVTDSRILPPPEQWRYATVPGVEILSNASDADTTRLVRDFERFRTALNVVWRLPDSVHTPLLLIVCGRDGKFEEFLPPGVDVGSEMSRASVYLHGRLRSAIVVDMEARELSLLSSQSLDDLDDISGRRITVDHDRQLYREYLYHLFNQCEPRLPAWFEEGMAQIVMGMKVAPSLIEFGALPNAIRERPFKNVGPDVPTTAVAGSGTDAVELAIRAPSHESLPDADFTVVLARRGLVPMPEFFSRRHDDPVVKNPIGNNVWSKQAYAFVHLCLFGKDGRWRPRLAELLRRSSDQPVTEALFKECFGLGFKQLGFELRGYIQHVDYESLEFRARKGEPGLLVRRPVELRDATPSEVGRIKGLAKRNAGRTEEARLEIIAPYTRGERDPALLVELGLSEQEGGKHDRARALLSAAISGRTGDSRAYLEMARYLYRDALATNRPDAPLGAAQVERIGRLLRLSIALSPRTVPTYDFYAEFLARHPGKPNREELAPLVAGVQLFPHRLGLTYATAVLCANGGIYEAAHSLVDHGIKVARDDATRARFNGLKQKLPRVAPAPVRPG